MLPFHCPIMPGEHLLGWVNRLHLLLGYPEIAASLKQLGISNTSFLYCRFNSAICDAISLYRREVKNDSSGFDKHTSLPMLSIGLPFERYAEMRLHNHGGIASEYRQARIACQANWKFCSLCVEEDLSTIGHSIWHVKHQLLGITHCVKHSVPLQEDFSLLKDLRRGALPQIHRFPLSDNVNEELLAWSQFCHDMLILLSNDAGKGAKIVARAREFLAIPKITKVKDNSLPIFQILQRRFENEMPNAVLSHLFPMDVKFKSHKVSPIKKVFGFDKFSPDRVHPIYSLALLYWLRNDLALVA